MVSMSATIHQPLTLVKPRSHDFPHNRKLSFVWALTASRGGRNFVKGVDNNPAMGYIIDMTMTDTEDRMTEHRMHKIAMSSIDHGNGFGVSPSDYEYRGYVLVGLGGRWRIMKDGVRFADFTYRKHAREAIDEAEDT